MPDSHKTKAALLAEVQRLRARLAQLEPDAALANTVTGRAIDPYEHFRAVADYTYDLESWIAPDGQLLWVNPAVERLTGYTVAECLSMPEYPLPLVHQDDQPQIARVFQDAVAGSSGNDVPFRLLCKGGDVRWVAVSWQPIHSGDGRCLGNRSSIRDISDRKRAEDALQSQRELLDSIITHIPCGVYWKDREGRYQGCNAAFARAAGVPRPDDIVGKNDYELAWDREQAEWFRSCDERVLATGEALLNIEEAERQADGRVAQLLTSKVPLRDTGGQVCGVLGIDTDISELKAAEAKLRQARDELEVRVRERTAALAAANEQLRSSQERYRLVAELTSDFAYAFRAEPGSSFHAEWVTDAFARITGHLPAELEPVSTLEQIVHPDDRPIVQRRAQVLLAGKALTTEFRVVTQDGRVRWLCDHARPIWDEHARCVVRVVGAAQDVTDRKQAEEEARQHQAALVHMARLSMLGELTAQLAHEINQPLCSIVGNAQTARRLLSVEPPDFVELRATLDDIAMHGNHAADVIRRLRDFLRLQQPKPVVLNTQRVIEDIAALAEADARQHEARIQFDLSPHLPAIRGDSIQIQQVILNLVHNGLEAMMEMPAGTRALTVRTRLDYASRVVVSVSDLGPGVPDALAARIFEPFFTTKSSGLGMGLVISRSIAEASDGSLWMTRDREHGTTFHLALPGYDSEGES
ncbi:MAG: PAS domain S-box protein [Anaerolineae bacterium]|nr:PAS domain S-box protein [Anaerolineae bacterium]